MYQKILTPPVQPVITPQRLAAFGRFDVPENYDDFQLLKTFIAAATEQVEILAATACQLEQVLLTLDFFPNTQDPRNWLQYELTYAFAITPWWWWGFPTKDSIELVRRPVQVPALSVTQSPITGVSVANNIVTVTCANGFLAGNVVVIAGTAEGNTSDPQTTPSTIPFLNGAPLTVLTASPTQFTASFNFGTLNGPVFTPGTYSNLADTGTATLWTNPCIVQYYDQNGILQTWNTTNYSILDDKICLSVGNWWPNTDRRQDCIQVQYWAGNATTPANVNPRLQMAVMFLAAHFWENRSLVAIEPTSEIHGTLCAMLSGFRTFRIPR